MPGRVWNRMFALVSLWAVLLAAVPAGAATLRLTPLDFVEIGSRMSGYTKSPVRIGSLPTGWRATFVARVRLPAGSYLRKAVMYHSGAAGQFRAVGLYAVSPAGSKVLAGRSSGISVNPAALSPLGNVLTFIRGADRTVRAGKEYIIVANCDPDSYLWAVDIYY